MPWPDRTIAEWTGEIAEDMGLIQLYTGEALKTERAEAQRVTSWAAAIKESRRLTSDLYRVAEKAGIARDKIDAERL